MRKFEIKMIGADTEGEEMCIREVKAVISSEKLSSAVFGALRKFEEHNGDNAPIDFISVNEITT